LYIVNDMEKNIQKPFKGPMLLCIVDGFGLREDAYGNAVKMAKTPTLDQLLNVHPHSALLTHGEVVGLPSGQMGNSEVGHMTIGSGRTILQSLDLIQQELKTDMSQNTVWQKALKTTEKSDKIHLIGMLSDGGVHSHSDHLLALCEKLQVLGKPILIHVILDGRDTKPKAGLTQLKAFIHKIKHLNNVHIADVCGRFYAMDRDNNWDRISSAYNLYTKSQATTTPVLDVMEAQYNKGNTDEFIDATAFELPGGLTSTVENNDSLFFFNFRADRMRQIVRTFIDTDLKVEGLKRSEKLNVHVICITEYDQTFNNRVITLFPPTLPQHTIGEVVASLGGKQLRIAESEKYAHVTFFLNGGIEKPFVGETRIVIPSPKVKTYDMVPKMSLPQVKDALLDAIENGDFDLIVLNIANGDQVGHSGSLVASIEAVEYIDQCLGEITETLKTADGEMVLIADHGNCEEMLDANGGICTSHTLNPVPFLYVGRTGFKAQNGSLKDVAPTILNLMNIKVPALMTGKNLLMRKDV
jgi:2,3-bisphosphoglycerate-independent phosphoglycerate mutase